LLKRPHFHPAACKVCGARAEDVGGISQQGFCPEHGFERFAANLEQLREKDGPFYEHWAMRGLLAYRRALVATRETKA
jgi:hypothetical protein